MRADQCVNQLLESDFFFLLPFDECAAGFVNTSRRNKSIFQSLDCAQEDCRAAANSIITDNHLTEVTK